MNNIPDYFSILEVIYTEKQRITLLRAIDSFLPLLYNVKTDVQAKINEFFPYEVSRALLTLAERNHIDLKNPIAVATLLHAVKEHMEKMPVVTLTLAFHPNGEFLAKVSDWLRSTFRIAFLIDFVVDSKIVAGVIISYKGAYRDYSFRRKFAEITEKKNFLEEMEGNERL